MFEIINPNPIKKRVIDSLKDMPEFRTIKIKQDITYSISVDSIKINYEVLQKYINDIEKRVSAGVLKKIYNENASIYGSLYHYEKTGFNTNGIEGCLRIYPHRLTSLSLEITIDSRNHMYQEYGFSKEIDKAFKIELKSLVEELLIPEIQILKRIKGLNKDIEQKQ